MFPPRCCDRPCRARELLRSVSGRPGPCVGSPSRRKFPYRFLPELLAGRGQIGLNGTSERLKLRKTLHLADSIRCGNRFRENPPPGTRINFSILSFLQWVCV